MGKPNGLQEPGQGWSRAESEIAAHDMGWRKYGLEPEMRLGMKDLLEKISSYNLFNYLLPGVLFALLAEILTSYKFIQSDIVVGIFLYYFIGLVTSRVGSLAIEPILKKTSFIKFAAYEDFVLVSEKDPKLEVLSEVNNMYRTLCSLFLLLGALKAYELLEEDFPLLASRSPYILLGLLFALFIFSYRKQTQYITKRIISRKNGHS